MELRGRGQPGTAAMNPGEDETSPLQHGTFMQREISLFRHKSQGMALGWRGGRILGFKMAILGASEMA